MFITTVLSTDEVLTRGLNVKTVVQRSFQSQSSVQSAIITSSGITAAVNTLFVPDFLGHVRFDILPPR